MDGSLEEVGLLSLLLQVLFELLNLVLSILELLECDSVGLLPCDA